jgi:hypothetical protein
MELLDELPRGEVLERAVLPDLIVLLSPHLYKYLVQELIPELSVERFYVSILPGAAGFNKERLQSQPLLTCPRDLYNSETQTA